MAETPSYEQKKFFELENAGAFNIFSTVQQNLRVSDLAENPTIMTGRQDVGPAAQYFASKGFGNLTVGEIMARANDPSFIQQGNLGKTFSYQDLALEALRVNPFYDPNDTNTLTALAQDLEKRGLTNANREEIRTLATSKAVTDQVDRAQNPSKYLNDQQKQTNLDTANRLVSQIYGQDFSDPDLASFISDRLAEGETAYEISQFLKTTPDYLKKQSDIENARVQEEAAAARNDLSNKLMADEEEAFRRAQPAIISSYMRAGRLGSSALDNALANARADLAREREGFVANAAYNDAIRAQGYAREDFLNNNAQAFSQYLRQNEPAYQQRFAVQNAGNYARYQQPWDYLNRQYSINDQNRQRQWDLEDYALQSSDYARYMSGQRRSNRQNLPWQLLGSLGAAGFQGWAMGGFK